MERLLCYYVGTLSPLDFTDQGVIIPIKMKLFDIAGLEISRKAESDFDTSAKPYSELNPLL